MSAFSIIIQTASNDARRLAAARLLSGGSFGETFARLPVAVSWAREDDRTFAAWNARNDLFLALHGQWTGGSLNSLFDAYDGRPASIIERLNGWFCGLLVDTRSNTATLFNDRYGFGRLYWTDTAESTAFSTTASALWKISPLGGQLDERGLGEWLSCGCVLQNRTLFKGIEILPPGSAWTISPEGRVAKRSWFNPATWEAQTPLSGADYDQKLQEIFPEILKRYANGSDPLGMSLTGGLDGRMIMAWSPRKSRSLPCYTFNGPYRDCADVRIARQIAEACAQPHTTIQLDHAFLKEFPALAAEAVRVSDGTMDVTGAAEIYANRLACQIAPARLTGNYGSEILRRYVAFRPRKLQSDLFAPGMSRYFDEAAATYASEANCHPLSFIAFKQVPWHHFSRYSVERSQINVRSPYLDNDLVALAYRAPAESASSLAPSLKLIHAGNPALASIPTDRGITYPADQASNRIQREFHEFLAKAEYAYDYGMPAWLAKLDRVLSPLHLEKLFLGHQKFCHFRTWYRNELSGFVQEVLLDPQALERPWVNRSQVERLVRAHVKGTANATTEIHKLLSLEMLSRELGAGSTEHGAGSTERGARSGEHGARSTEHGAGSGERGAGSTERGLQRSRPKAPTSKL